MTKKNMTFYKLPVEIAASKELTPSEKIIAAYLFTLFGNNLDFYGSNGLLSSKLDVQKSIISKCLTKFESLGWITITDRQGIKRKISLLNNPCNRGDFYRLYTSIAASNRLTSLEKILISYILSFTDNRKRFYAKNAMVHNVLDISKEGFNTSRVKFEAFNWVMVKYPKTHRRELAVINHPIDNMPPNFPSKGCVDMPPTLLQHNGNLPENGNKLPVTSDNKISDKISKKKSITIEDIREVGTKKNTSLNSNSSTINFVGSKVNQDLFSTNHASQEANASGCIIPHVEEHTSTSIEASTLVTNVEEHTSTRNEAHASVTSLEEHTSTSEGILGHPLNTIDEVAASIISEATVKTKKVRDSNNGMRFDISKYLNESEFTSVRSYVIDLSKTDGIKEWTIIEANKVLYDMPQRYVDKILVTLGLD